MSIDVLDLAFKTIPIAVTVIALTYTITQRRNSKKQMAQKLTQKKYLEDALTTLNKQIEILNNWGEPTQLNMVNPLIDDFTYDASTIAWGLLRAAFDTEKRKMRLKVIYHVRYSEKSDNEKTMNCQEITDFTNLDSKWLLSMLHSKKFDSIYADSEVIIEENPQNLMNNLQLPTVQMLYWLNMVRRELSKFEEVYENISPNSIRDFDKFFEELTEDAFSILSSNRKLEIDLDNFETTNILTLYLAEAITDFSKHEQKVPKLKPIINQLNEARKQLFSKYLDVQNNIGAE